MYKIELKPAAQRKLSKLPQDVQKQIATKINSLQENPLPARVEKLSGSKVLYRVRVRAYRIIYEIHDELLVVLVVQIGHRREVYRRY